MVAERAPNWPQFYCTDTTTLRAKGPKGTTISMFGHTCQKIEFPRQLCLACKPVSNLHGRGRQAPTDQAPPVENTYQHGQTVDCLVILCCPKPFFVDSVIIQKDAQRTSVLARRTAIAVATIDQKVRKDRAVDRLHNDAPRGRRRRSLGTIPHNRRPTSPHTLTTERAPTMSPDTDTLEAALWFLTKLPCMVCGRRIGDHTGKEIHTCYHHAP